MNTKISISIKRRTQSYWLIMVLMLMPFALGTLNDLMGLPYALRYLSDVAWLMLLLLLILNEGRRKAADIGLLTVWTLLFLGYTLLVYLVNFQSPLYYLWAVRNNFRFYVAFFAVAAFLTREDAAWYYRLFDRLFWLNFGVSLIQYFFFDLEQDFLGGIFGVQSGCNAYQNIFCLIVVTKSILLYLDKKESAMACICKCMASLIIGALAELKFYFVEFLLVAALAVLFTGFTWRKLAVILGGCAAAFAGAALLTVVFPSFTDWFSLSWFLEVATAQSGYTATGDLNRLTAIISINDLWLKDFGQRLFGLGMGNCETASYAFLNTPFYRQNGHMHYNWISYAHMYLECGWLGLLFYFGFFGIVFFRLRGMEKQTDGMVKNYCRLARIMAVLSVVIAVYNSSLRAEPAYMLYFTLAVPFAVKRSGTGYSKKS